MSKSGRYDLTKLENVLEMLASESTSPAKLQDHALTGSLNQFRECRIEPDWLLMYRREKSILIIELVATGTHSELFG